MLYVVTAVTENDNIALLGVFASEKEAQDLRKASSLKDPQVHECSAIDPFDGKWIVEGHKFILVK